MAEVTWARNRRTLRFIDPALERDFQAELAVANGPQLRMGTVAAVVLWLLAAVITPLAITTDTVVVEAICLGMAAANLIGFGLARGATSLDAQQAIGLVLNALAGLAVLALTAISGASERFAAPAILLIAIFAFVVIRLRFVFALVAASTYLVGFIGLVLTRPEPAIVLEIFLVAAAIAVGLAATYLLEVGARDVFVQRRVIEAQAAALAEAQATSERLLLNVLPGSIADRLKLGETTIADGFEDATILFADLVGFTPLAARLTPRETIELLDRLFTGFDELAERHGLEKIKTIGDAYMVVGGVPVPSDDHPQRVLAMGLDMLEFVTVVARELGRQLDLRIGMHTGPVVAGVIGTRKFSYDLWGDTVNIASRLESHGVSGAIQMSEPTWRRVETVAVAQARGQVELKGRGPMETFLVTRAAS